ERLDRIEIAAVILPRPRQAVQDGMARNVLDRLHHAGQQFLVGGPAGREGDAAIAEQGRRDAMPAHRRAIRIPADLGVEMGVDVDKAGCDGHTLGVDLALGRTVELADTGDRTVLDAEVCTHWRRPGAVDQHATSDGDVVTHGASSSRISSQGSGTRPWRSITRGTSSPTGERTPNQRRTMRRPDIRIAGRDPACRLPRRQGPYLR